MKISKRWIFEIVFTIIAGTLLHFAYEFSGENTIVGIFSPVNESVWEHFKMLFTPIFLLTLVEYAAWGRRYDNFLLSRAESILLGMLFIAAAFYTYTGVLGRHLLSADIAIFILAVVLAFTHSEQRFYSETEHPKATAVLGTALMGLLLLAFAVFTFAPPHIPLFMDSTTGSFGI